MPHNAQEITDARRQNPKMRDRDFARSIGISEAELVAAYCARGEAKRIKVDIAALFDYAHDLGTVMALTRNESVVHETIGTFDKLFPGEAVSMTLGEIDLRIFQENWCYGFAREIDIRGTPRKSLQFFDAQGTAVFKLYEQENSNWQVWIALIDKLLHEDQSGQITVMPKCATIDTSCENPDIETFRQKWRLMNDVHQLHDILKEMRISRHDAVKFVAQEFSRELAPDMIAEMLASATANNVPIMCFVGNHGCIQIATGTVGPVKMMGDWLNLLDKSFHLHLHLPDIDKVWLVQKPTKDGLVSSLEVFDANGNLIIQFFGERKEGKAERAEWRALLDALPNKKQPPLASSFA